MGEIQYPLTMLLLLLMWWDSSRKWSDTCSELNRGWFEQLKRLTDIVSSLQYGEDASEMLKAYEEYRFLCSDTPGATKRLDEALYKVDGLASKWRRVINQARR